MSREPWDFLQETLDIDVSEDERLTIRREISKRSSLSRMVDLALDRGYASSVGDLIDQTSNLRQHKLFNALLACLQRPHSDYLLQSHDWEDRWRRIIRPNEPPIVLMVPFSPVGFYFDVSQTEETERSRQLPARFENPYRMKYVQDAGAALTALRERVVLEGVRVTEAPLGHRFAGHIKRSSGGRQEVPVRVGGRVVVEEKAVRFEVGLNRSYTPTEKLATLAHEIGHLYCGHLGSAKSDWWPDRTGMEEFIREYEAESVARLVFRRLAPGAELPDHLEQYFDSDAPVPDAGWARVVSAADRIIDHCLAGVSESATSLLTEAKEGRS